ncbi:MAG: hypothetical protein QXU14_08370 [Metallosphaera sp.]
MISQLFNCNQVKVMRTGDLSVELDGVRCVYEVKSNLSPVMEITLKSRNYKSECKVLFDVRLDKVVSVSCEGVKQEKVRLTLEECFREKGLLYIK